LIIFIASFLYSATLVEPIEQYPVYDRQKAKLGKQLFLDTRLSKDNTIACISCHDIYSNGAESTRVSTGIGGQKGDRNSPTIFNSSYNFRQFWDGRARDLKEQVLGPIANPVEMGNTLKNVVDTLKKDQGYRYKFSKIYKDGITIDNIADAIAEFEKALTTPDSKFDKYLRGDKDILSQDEKDGFELFKKKGCVSCHNGKNLGANMYHKFGVVIFVDDSMDLGRYNVTKKNRDKFLFKVPSLRNVAITAPYFHDGRSKTLEDAIRLMAQRQVGRTINEDEIVKIVKFLHTLTGDKPKILEEE
jgi:cytochrome c peroxidase